MANYRFKLRGKREIELRGLDSMVAAGPEEIRRGGLRSTDTAAARVIEAAAEASLNPVDLAVLAKANWRLIPATGALARAARDRVGGAAALTVHEVLASPRGRVFLGTDLVTVGFPDRTSKQQSLRWLAEHELQPTRKLPLGPVVYEARVKPGVPLLVHVEELQRNASGEGVFVEPVLREVISGRWRPNDPRYSEQWHWRNDGSNGGTAGADVNIESAWALTRGQRSDGAPVRLAVLDNGMDVAHEDLRVGLSKGGYFEDKDGASVFHRRRRGDHFPASSHGTACLGMAGARARNGLGGCGAAPRAKMIPIACSDDQVSTQVTLALAIIYAALPHEIDVGAAAGDGADVISCSLGPNDAQWDMTSALDLAIGRATREGRTNRGTAIFWAVSNGTHDIKHDEVVSHPEVVAVGRSNRLDLKDGSAFGPTLAFLAPGREVLTTVDDGNYGLVTGTSFAAPLAAGVAGLVLARAPTMTRDELAQHLRANCKKVGGVTYDGDGRHDEYGHGRLDAGAAVTTAPIEL